MDEPVPWKKSRLTGGTCKSRPLSPGSYQGLVGVCTWGTDQEA